MQKIIFPPIAIFMIGLASCSEVETIEPAAEQQQLTTRPVDIRILFDHQNHNVVELDIDEDGKTDFLFFAKDVAGPGWENLALVGLLSAREGNEVLALSAEQDRLCQMGIPMSPGITLSASEGFDASSVWATDAMLYGRSLMNNGCEQHKKYIDYGQDRYIGVRFLKGAEMTYGWVKLVAVDSVDGEYPESADIWKISEFGYSLNGSAALQIPA